MIKANELMINNWVLADGKPYKIKHISPDDEWVPIELSPEILEKAGAKNLGVNKEYVIGCIKTNDGFVQIHFSELSKECYVLLINDGKPLSISRRYKYLHELQNVYAYLTGTELEINNI